MQALWCGSADCVALLLLASAVARRLVELLGTGALAAKDEAMGALLCLADKEPSNQLAIAAGLVALLGTGTAESQEFVSRMLLQFAQGATNRRAIADAGAVRLLVQQIRISGAETSLKARELAASVLARLVNDPAGDPADNVSKVASSGGIKALLMLLCTGSGRAESRAAYVLGTMARSSREIQQRIISEGGVEPLVRMLSEGTSLEARVTPAAALQSTLRPWDRRVPPPRGSVEA